MNLYETIEYLEKVTVADLVGKSRNHPQISDLTAKFKSLRRSQLGRETGLASCDAAGFMNNGQDIVFIFSTIAESANAKRVNSKTSEIEDNPSGKYTLLLCFIDGLAAVKAIKNEEPVQYEEPEEDLEDEEIDNESEEIENEEEASEKDVNDEVTDSEEDENERPMGEDIYESVLREYNKKRDQLTAQDIKDLVEACDVKIWCDDPSTTWQGHNYYLTQIDGSLYPNNIKPKRWNKYHHDDNFMGKHTAALLQTLPNFYAKMAKQLNALFKRKNTWSYF